MRKFLLLFMTVGILLSCNNDKKTTDTVTQSDEKSDAATTASVAVALKQTPLQIASKPYEKLLGSFVGPFGNNKITMLITAVAGDSVVGRTIVGGNDRPFRGTFSKNGNMYSFSAKEPGDHKDDGVFNFTIDETTADKVTGSWKPFAKGRPGKEYQLDRRKFEYRTDVGEYPEASQRLLKPADVENMMKEDLQFMRNEIFARHGFCFNKKELRQMFEMEDWYVPNTVDIRGLLTAIEKKNIDLIKRYEKYAEEYGDEYGR
ncbi:MAG: YARHG domain-containing protein [Chitinophagaceae bacterium]|nr:YARHG domain-containing protein [Chitinophagaceae bacterium]